MVCKSSKRPKTQALFEGVLCDVRARGWVASRRTAERLTLAGSEEERGLIDAFKFSLRGGLRADEARQSTEDDRPAGFPLI